MVTGLILGACGLHVEVSLSKRLNPRSHLKLHRLCKNMCVWLSPDDHMAYVCNIILYLFTVVFAHESKE